MRTGTMEVSVYTYPMEGTGPPPVWEEIAQKLDILASQGQKAPLIHSTAQEDTHA